MAGITRSSRWRGILAKTPEAAPLFAALGDETRLRLLGRLSAEGPQSITRLTAGTRVTRQAITKHLHVLRQAGLVRASRHGRERRWELETARLRAAQRLLEIIAGQWERALMRLKAHLERE